MPRQTEPFSLIQRPPSPYFYYKLAGWKHYKSTGKKTKTGAMKVIEKAQEEQKKQQIRNTFRQYAEPYFIWETCPRV
jgi:hypothetical protein